MLSSRSRLMRCVRSVEGFVPRKPTTTTPIGVGEVEEVGVVEQEGEEGEGLRFTGGGFEEGMEFS